MENNKPRSREKNVTGNGKGVHKGSAVGGGPVGGGRGGSGNGGSNRGPGNGGGKRSGGSGGMSGMKLLIGLLVVLLGGGGGAMSLLGGSDSTTTTDSGSSGSSSSWYQEYTGQTTTNSWSTDSNTGDLDTTVAAGSRDKYTTIKGDGSDTTTIMVYMCGTDLESKSGMATNDLKEMASATIDDNINLIVYTGGCTGWKINGISSKVNQIYQIKNGKMYCLESDMGDKCMTTPSTLTEFINYCTKNYPADRQDLIFWDHGGGSVSGYGYDQKYSSSGSMKLSGISQALKDAKTKFDFIGFDACLMATAENALMLNDYADYLIASEETEPGVGWYYTTWLTEYSKDPSMDTLTIGKNIVDTFVKECASSCKGQQTTLSVIDLAEFSNTVPSKLNEFASATTQLIKDNEYTTVANARSSAREFAQSSKIDQVDLIDLCKKMNTDASNELVEVLESAVKYNLTSTNMTNAYGVSIYFPNRNKSYVDTAVSINDSIGMDDEYNSCIKAYASLNLAGSTAAYGNGNTGSAAASLLGEVLSGTSGSDMTSQLLNALLSAGTSSLTSSGKANFMTEDRALSDDQIVEFVTNHQFDASALTWNEDSDGNPIINISEDQWNLVTDLEINMFYDDGEGYVDLGTDNLFEINDDGALVGSADKTWLSINGQPVAYYHTATMELGDDEYTITGRVPCYLNGERGDLLLTFDNDNPYGYISGFTTEYENGETETVAKAQEAPAAGDELQFICDYYTYDGEYQDTYTLGDPMTVTDEMEISNTAVGDGNVEITYKFTDIYDNAYWTPVMPMN